ncbi:MAG: hypothetical protein P4N24_04410 [Acidobacteriota bacterium]|nr:hypothetical protein [Acidobacteriota bacterium]
MRKFGRRDLLKNSLGASAALVGGISYEHKALMAHMMAPAQEAQVKEPVKGLQRGKFGKYEVSRLIIGGDPVSGIAHAGELVYQADFMKQYFNTSKILETLTVAEQNGINTLLMRADDRIISHYNLHKKERGGKLQWIATSAPEQGSPVENSKRARDNGAIAVYLHGGVADGLVKAGKVDEIGEIVEGFKKVGIMAGIGAHMLDTARACVQARIDPDFYMVTINRVNYYCSEAAEVGIFMRSIKKPWIAFKVLGAGRVKPAEGFRLAFEHGGDFLAVGMFDWQIRDDVALVQEMLEKGIHRDRDWA